MVMVKRHLRKISKPFSFIKYARKKGWKLLSETGHWGYCEEGSQTHYADFIQMRKALPFAKKLCRRHLKEELEIY